MTSTPPQRVMCFALRQKICLVFNRRCANAVAAVNAAGKIGGMTTVTISRALRITSSGEPCNNKILSFDVNTFHTCKFCLNTPFLI